jgi:hypothetical protein
MNDEIDDQDDQDDQDFDNEEHKMNVQLKNIAITRIPCAIHVLQRVIHCTEKYSPFKKTIKSAMKLIKSIRTSGIKIQE